MTPLKVLGFIAVAVLAIPSTHGWLSKHIVKKDVNETVDEVEMGEQMFSEEDPVSLCSDYWRLSCTLRSCQNMSWPERPNATFVLNSLNELCGNEDQLRACFQEKVSHCDNRANLTSRLDETFSYCVNDKIPADVTKFLESNKDVTLDKECLDTIFDLTSMSSDRCNVSTRPPCGEMETVEQSIQMFEDSITWYIKCFMTTGLDEIPDTCDVTRRTAYSVLVASLQVFDAYGMNQYENFDILQIVE